MFRAIRQLLTAAGTLQKQPHKLAAGLKVETEAAQRGGGQPGEDLLVHASLDPARRRDTAFSDDRGMVRSGAIQPEHRRLSFPLEQLDALRHALLAREALPDLHGLARLQCGRWI